MIRVIDNYGITADGNCFIIGEITTIKTKIKDGKIKEQETLKNAGFYSTLQKALEGLAVRIQRDTIKNMDCDLKSAVVALRASNERVANAINEAIPKIEV